MEDLRHQIEASLSRTRNVIMEDRYRRLHYDPTVIGSPYWTQPPPKNAVLSNGRLKKHLPTIPKKKSKDGSSKTEHFDVPNYLKPYRDKYGSVSAHSTSAIYGALRAPHCHAMYNPSDMWYASVRSLNSRPRDVVYPAEAYDWREPIYEDLSREGCPISPPHDLHHRPHCCCMIRRKPPSTPLKSSRPPPRCKYCATVPLNAGSLKGVPLSSKRTSLISDKVKLVSVSEEKDEIKSESTDRMSGYKKRLSGSSKPKSSRYLKETAAKEAMMISRKSILECDVTAYDLIKKTPKSPSISEVEDSDIDDDLSDNAVVKQNRTRLKKNQSKTKASSSKIEGLVHRSQKALSLSKFQKSQSENNIYNEATSVLLGGQRIFTNHQSSKSPDVFNGANASNENVSTNGESCSARWRKISVSEESVCIPEPDYDNSEDSDDARLNNSFKDLKLTYSPPLLRKSSLDSNSGLGVSRELSKSMSSLLSEDTIVPNISLQHSYKSSPTIIRTKKHTEISPCHELNEPPRASKLEVPENSVINIYSSDISIENLAAIDIPSTSHHGLFKDTKFESFSSSDCSSNGGTLSSDYPTWTSSSSSELKSILKKKRRRENVIQEREIAVKASSDSESKDSQRKKQVQFRASADDTVFVELIQNDDSEADKFAQGVYAEVSEHNALDVSLNGTCDNAVISNNEKSTIMSASSVIECNDNIYESISKATNGRDSVLGKEISASSLDNFMFMKGGDGYCCGNDQPSGDEVGNHSVLSALTGLNQADKSKSRSQIQRESITPNSIHEISELPMNLRNAIGMPVSSLTPKLSGRSSSLEDIRDSGNLRNRQKDSDLDGKKGDSHSRRRRTTLPKRRFSDLHLHILLCPTRTSLCGDGSSSDDVPLTTTPHRAHRSLPESPSELDDETPTFCFDFIEKTPKEKVLPSSRSTFYVSVDGSSQPEALKKDDVALLGKSTSESTQTELDNVVAPSIDSNLILSASDDEQLDSRDCDLDGVTSPLQEDTDEDNLENEYENLDPIYEELSDVSNSSKRLPLLESPQKSFFEGASKTDILSYLEDAKERGLSEGLSEDEIKAIIEEDEDEDTKVLIPEDDDGEKNRVIVNNTLNHQEVLSEGDEAGNSLEHIVTETITEETNKVNRSPSAEVERNDSGVGAETSKPSRISKLLSEDSEEQLCADCDHQVEPVEDELSGLLFSPLVCRKCDLRRCERKEIIIEFVDTELKYGRDLRIIKEEFYRPMEIAGLLAKELLLSVFLNLDELTRVNTKFSEKLQDALDIAMEQGDEDYTTVNIGKIFLETSSMLHAFETYCVKQASASVILNNLEKEKELLRIFLRVSQMENTLLRRMNLPAFLMVPVQRVTRYPLLLSRLHKVTPIHHKDRNALKEAQQKVELHLEHINQQTKGVGGTKIWRRISNISASHRRLGNLQDIGSIKLRKMALEILKWKQDEVRFVMAGKLLFTQVTDYPWNKKGRTVKFTHLHALLVALGKPNSNYRPEMATTDSSVLFPRNTGIRDACLILMKEKNGRFIFVRDPLYLGSCVISCDSDADDVFEIQEYTTKEAYLLKGESKKDTKEWLRQLRYHAKDLGSWRRRRNALANIMINGMIRQ